MIKRGYTVQVDDVVVIRIMKAVYREINAKESDGSASR